MDDHLAKASYSQIKFFEQLDQFCFKMVLFYLIVVFFFFKFFEWFHNRKDLYQLAWIVISCLIKVMLFCWTHNHTSCAKLWVSGVSCEEIMRNGWTHRLFSAKIKMDNENISPHNGGFRYSQNWCINKCYILKGINADIFKTITHEYVGALPQKSTLNLL